MFLFKKRYYDGEPMRTFRRGSFRGIKTAISPDDGKILLMMTAIFNLCRPKALDL